MIRLPDPGMNGDFFTNPNTGEPLTLVQRDTIAAALLCGIDGAVSFAPSAGMYAAVIGPALVRVGIPELGITLSTEN